jgi:hypothetical protein
MLKQNVGQVDRLVRLILGLVIVSLGLYFGSWWGLLGVIPLGTAAMSSCLLYSLFGISTCPIEPKK